jgi:hypothetical protein
MKKSDIKAQVMYQWDRKQCRNCKLIPGDRVIYFKHSTACSNILKKYINKVGAVIAVTTIDGEHIRCGGDRIPRCSTKYYVEFEDGEVFGILSGNLNLVESEEDTIESEENADYCKVINSGYTYSRAIEAAGILNLTNFAFKQSPQDGKIYKIISKSFFPIGKNVYRNCVVYVIEDIYSKKQYIIEKEGVEEVKYSPAKKKEPVYNTVIKMALPYIRGYEYTGEFRIPKDGEFYSDGISNEVKIGHKENKYQFILK